MQPKLPYETAIFVKSGKRVGSIPLTTEPPETMVWGNKDLGECLWRADGSVGNFEFRYVFVKQLPRVADGDAESQ